MCVRWSEPSNAANIMKLKGIIKLCISLAMLFLVLRFTDFHALWGIISSISPSLALLVVFGYFLGQVTSSFKWWNLARAGGVEVPYITALRAYFIGMFVNCFGFGTVGGDLARGILIADGKPVKAAAVTSVIADRAHGLAVLAIIGTVSIMIFGSHSLESHYILLLGLFGLMIIGGWFIGPAIVRAIFREDHRWRDRIDRLLAAFPHNPRTILYITTISIFFHLLQISLHKIMGLAVGVDISWAVLLVAIPFVNILSSLPISWNGLGVRENAYVFFLFPAVLSKEQCLAFGALWLLSVTVCSAIGGIWSVVTRDFEILSHVDPETGEPKAEGIEVPIVDRVQNQTSL